MGEKEQSVLFITDKKFVDYTIPGGVQLCTAEFIEYFTEAGFKVNILKVNTSTTLTNRVKAKLGLEAYEIYNVAPWLDEIVETINNENIKLVLFNQLNLSYWAVKIKKRIGADVKFIGLSHGNESGDYLHDITKTGKTSLLQTWRLGKLLVKEKTLFSKLLNGVISISDHETYIDQWLGAQNIMFLPRILKPGFINWHPKAKTIGFVGTLDHLPNLSGIGLLSDHLQLNGFSGDFRLVGSPAAIGHQLEKKYGFIQYCGALGNQQLIEEVGSWCLFLNPVFWYARGSSTKLSQGINWGVPVLTTPAGTRGYDLCDHNIVVPDNTPEIFADTIIKTLNTSTLANQLKKASVANCTNFNLTAWAKKLSEFLIKL